MVHRRQVRRRGLWSWRWTVAGDGGGTHVWFGEARSRRDAERAAERLVRELAALDDYTAALVRARDPAWLERLERASLHET